MADGSLEHAIKCTRTRLKAAERSLYGRHSSVYLMCLHMKSNAYECPFKIGQSIDPSTRLHQLSRHAQYPMSIVSQFPTDHADLAEYRLHVIFERARIRDEWFSLDRAALQVLVNIASFERGEYHMYRDQVKLPYKTWDGVINLPF